LQEFEGYAQRFCLSKLVKEEHAAGYAFTLVSAAFLKVEE